MPGIIEDWRELTPDQGPSSHQTGANPENVGVDRRWTRPADTSEDALFGTTQPAEFMAHEKTWHRRSQELKLQGFSDPEIASMLGKSRAQVMRVLAQPWARERMNNRMKEDASVEIKAFLEAQCLPSLQVLAEIRDNPELKAADRRAAADSLADRFLGRAAQPIYDASETKPVDQLTNDELSAQVNRLVEGMAATPTNPNEP